MSNTIEDVMNRLAESDEPAAASAAEAEYLERHLKIVFASELLKCSEGTVAEREAKARNSEAYKAAHEQLKEVKAESLLYKNQRSTDTMRFEYWRSVNANRRQGNMT